MNRIITCLSFIGVSLVGMAQSASPEVMATSGSHLDNGSMQMSFTIGEPITETETNAANTATQGFHQTKLSALGTEDLQPDVLVEVYPNPTQDQLFIASDQLDPSAMIHLFDSKGALVYESAFGDAKHQIDFTLLQQGTYFLKLSQTTQSIKTFTIQKLQ